VCWGPPGAPKPLKTKISGRPKNRATKTQVCLLCLRPLPQAFRSPWAGIDLLNKIADQSLPFDPGVGGVGRRNNFPEALLGNLELGT
jgi:hypothetical protein